MGLAEFFVRIVNVYSGQDLNPFNYTGKSESPDSINNSEGAESTKCDQACLIPEPQDSLELNNIPVANESQSSGLTNNRREGIEKHWATWRPRFPCSSHDFPK